MGNNNQGEWDPNLFGEIQPESAETVAEKIHTEEEVFALMEIEGVRIEDLDASLVDRRSDEKGLWRLTITQEAGEPGETMEYTYMRAGDHGNQNAAAESRIDIVYYSDGIPVGSNQTAVFRDGAWKKLAE